MMSRPPEVRLAGVVELQALQVQANHALEDTLPAVADVDPAVTEVDQERAPARGQPAEDRLVGQRALGPEVRSKGRDTSA